MEAWFIKWIQIGNRNRVYLNFGYLSPAFVHQSRNKYWIPSFIHIYIYIYFSNVLIKLRH